MFQFMKQIMKQKKRKQLERTSDRDEKAEPTKGGNGDRFEPIDEKSMMGRIFIKLTNYHKLQVAY